MSSCLTPCSIVIILLAFFPARSSSSALQFSSTYIGACAVVFPFESALRAGFIDRDVVLEQGLLTQLPSFHRLLTAGWCSGGVTHHDLSLIEGTRTTLEPSARICTRPSKKREGSAWHVSEWHELPLGSRQTVTILIATIGTKRTIHSERTR